jgi:hypothetical protein
VQGAETPFPETPAHLRTAPASGPTGPTTDQGTHWPPLRSTWSREQGKRGSVPQGETPPVGLRPGTGCGGCWRALTAGPAMEPPEGCDPWNAPQGPVPRPNNWRRVFPMRVEADQGVRPRMA